MNLRSKLRRGNAGYHWSDGALDEDAKVPVRSPVRTRFAAARLANRRRPPDTAVASVLRAEARGRAALLAQ